MTYLWPCSRKPIIAGMVLVIALAVYLPYFSIDDIISRTKAVCCPVGSKINNSASKFSDS
jgi:hypothetical protein